MSHVPMTDDDVMSHITHLIQNSKRCSTLEVVHAIGLKIYKHDRKALKLK